MEFELPYDPDWEFPREKWAVPATIAVKMFLLYDGELNIYLNSLFQFDFG